MNFRKFLNQTAVHWENNGLDGFGKVILASSPSEIPVRWSDDQGIYSNPQGEEVKAKTVILSQDEVKINDYLFLGQIVDLDSGDLANPEQNINIFKVKHVNQLIDIKGVLLGYQIYLDESTV